MKAESRVRKTFLNARVNLIFYFLTLALSFFSRKIFLDSLGADFIGLTGSLTSLLGFLNLAELGIGAAIGYVLYKPLFEQDRNKISEIVSVLGYLYKCVGIIILCLGIVLSVFLPFIYDDTNFGHGIIYFAYYSFLLSSLIGYFINYRQTLLSADQRNYVVTAYFQTASIIKTLLQMLLAYYTGNYYLWVLIELVFGVVHAIILNWKINKVYPWLKTDIKNGRELRKKYPEVLKYTKQLFIHKIGEVTQSQVTTFLVYTFGSLQAVAYYGNYTIVTSKLSSLISNFLGSTTASVGNLISEGDKTKSLDIYWELTALNFYIAGVCAIALYYLLPPFIALWLGTEYIMSERVLILLIISFCLSLIRTSTSQFKYGFGLFADIWSPVAESLILILVATIGGKLWGLEGVLLGGIVSVVVVICGWQAYYLFKRGFNISVLSYIYNFTLNVLVLLGGIYIASIPINRLIVLGYDITWVDLIKNCVLILLVHGAISLGLMIILIPGMRTFLNRLLKLLSRYK